MSNKRLTELLNYPPIRLILGLIGFGIMLFFFVYSFRWEDFGIDFSILGVNISVYAYASFAILAGIVGSSLFKSAILKKGKIDI